MKLKDVITAGNLLGGTASVIALLNDNFQWAVWFFFLAYLFDHLDGPVARLLKQQDTFGAHFDSACDFITSSIVAGFIVYYAFRHQAGWPVWAAGALGAFPQLFGTIRQAQQQDRPLSFPCYWLGLPRPAAAIFIIALLNSSIMAMPDEPWRQIGYGYIAFLVVVLSFAHLSTFPFGHNKNRRFMGPMRFGVYWFLGGSPLVLLVAWLGFGAPEVFFDWIVVSLHAYVFLSWTQIPKADFQKIKKYVAGGPIETPLVHKDHTWRAKTWAPYFEDTSAFAPEVVPGSEAPA